MVLGNCFKKYLIFPTAMCIIMLTHLTCLEGESGFRIAITGFFISYPNSSNNSDNRFHNPSLR